MQIEMKGERGRKVINAFLISGNTSSTRWGKQELHREQVWLSRLFNETRTLIAEKRLSHLKVAVSSDSPQKLIIRVRKTGEESEWADMYKKSIRESLAQWTVKIDAATECSAFHENFVLLGVLRRRLGHHDCCSCEVIIYLFISFSLLSSLSPS